MLQAAAQRGVKVRIIGMVLSGSKIKRGSILRSYAHTLTPGGTVYKEVTQALTRKYLSPILPKYLHSLLPQQRDTVTFAMTRLGLAATFASLEYAEAENPLISPPLIVDSAHSKHALEDLHPNISVFRHPDHLPDAQTLESSFISSLQHMSLTAATASRLPGDALKAIYGMNEDVILYWAHHEKLCLIDGHIAFMGGLDLCYGRWDTWQHSIADAHPRNLDDIVFPGQDYNNARIMDFSDVQNWEKNALDRTKNSRMGWSDLSIGVLGPVVEDLKAHFVERWNFIFNEKYDVRKDTRYSRLTLQESPQGMMNQGQPSGTSSQSYENTPPLNYQSQPYFPPPPVSARGISGNFDSPSDRHPAMRRFETEAGTATTIMKNKVEARMHQMEGRPDAGAHPFGIGGGMTCQVVRSCTNWSHGVDTEHSIADAYIKVIRDSQHFVYIENQFFITATSNSQKPVLNKLGAAMVERIVRAARAGEKYKIIVVMPAIPAFAGDLKDESSLGTRAIMDYQYKSINRGGHSIMEEVAAAGFDPEMYIRFYNLRNYDRLNVSASMQEAENASGVNYEEARKNHDNTADPYGRGAEAGLANSGAPLTGQNYQNWKTASSGIADRKGLGSGRWDSVAECYMLGGTDIRDVPWEDGNTPEIEAFVSEELYIHTKILIADDRVVICGSANLNDRSQLGYHDSEIALVIEDPDMIDSRMSGQPFRVSKFAASLRRQLFRKHLGLVRPQNMEHSDPNFEPVGIPNSYEFGSTEDQAVMDPLSDQFLTLWNGRAKRNTDAFGRIFHPVPHDSVRTWKDYEKYYEYYFHEAQGVADGKKTPARYQSGHVITENFSTGVQGLRELKDLLSTIKGTLVEMPLLFLIDEDIAGQGLSLNAFTEVIYT